MYASLVYRESLEILTITHGNSSSSSSNSSSSSSSDSESDIVERLVNSINSISI